MHFSRTHTHTYIHLSYEENPRGTCSLGLLASSIRFVLNREAGGGGVRFCRGCITDRWGRWRKSEAERRTIHRKEEKRVTGIATNHSSRFLLVFFFLSPLLSLSWRSGKTKKDRAKERDREEIEDNSLEFHRDQHFSIRRIIHFFSIGRSPSLFSYPSRSDTFFFLRVQPPGHCDVLVGCFSKYWSRGEIGENSSLVSSRISSLWPPLEINRSINLPSIILSRQKFYLSRHLSAE